MRGRYSSSGNERRDRSLVLGIAGLLILIVLLGRLFILQVVTADRSRELAKRNWLRPEYLPGPRGRILDREGAVMAEMVPAFVVGIDPQLDAYVRHPERLDATLKRLARLLGGDAERYHELIQRQRGTSYKPVRLERNADSVMVARVEEHRGELPGVAVEVEPVRRYPADSLAAHVLGYIGEVTDQDLERYPDARPGSTVGKTGVELQYESILRGIDGIRYVEVNALGRRSEAFNREQPVPPRPGRDVQLSIDIDLQRATERALDEAGYDGGGERPEVRGAAILMNVWTGEVLAMASRPGFDVNLFSRSISQEEWDSLTREGHPLLNRAIQAAYPPGSVFKPVTEYAALAEGVVKPSQFLSPCLGGHRFGNRVFHCWKRGGHGALESVGALANSCDIFFYQLAPPLGVDGIARYANRFHVADLTGVDLPRERKGLIPDSGYYDKRLGKRNWGPGVALNLIIGQGEIQLTPVQLVQNMGVFATGGRRVRPRLLKGIGEAAPAPGEERPAPAFPTPPIEPEYEDIRLDAAALQQVRRGLLAAVENGTAKAARVFGRSVAGKTGTAQNPGFDHALFVAYAPADNPEVAAVVLLENRGHGGSVAAPVARRMFSAYFGIPDSMVAQGVVESD